MPQPDWTAIFTLRPELDPPGYAETFLDMVDNPYVKPAARKAAGKRKGARFPSLKHGAT